MVLGACTTPAQEENHLAIEYRGWLPQVGQRGVIVTNSMGENELAFIRMLRQRSTQTEYKYTAGDNIWLIVNPGVFSWLGWFEVKGSSREGRRIRFTAEIAEYTGPAVQEFGSRNYRVALVDLGSLGPGEYEIDLTWVFSKYENHDKPQESSRTGAPEELSTCAFTVREGAPSAVGDNTRYFLSGSVIPLKQAVIDSDCIIHARAIETPPIWPGLSADRGYKGVFKVLSCLEGDPGKGEVEAVYFCFDVNNEIREGKGEEVILLGAKGHLSKGPLAAGDMKVLKIVPATGENLQEVKKLLASVDRNPDVRALASAVGVYDLDEVKRLVEKGVNPNAVITNWRHSGNAPPVIAAAWKTTWGNRTKLLSYLVANGADINSVDSVGFTAYDHALKHFTREHIDLVKKLGGKRAQDIDPGYLLFRNIAWTWIDEVGKILSRDCNVDVRNCHGETPLIFACSLASLDPQTQAVEALIAKGADVNAKSNLGFTALHWTAQFDLGLTKLLLKAHADVNVLSNPGVTPLDLARAKEIIAFLRKHGAKTSKELQEEDK